MLAKRISSLAVATMAIAALGAFLQAHARVCEKPDGKFFGISDFRKCPLPSREAISRPNGGFLGLQNQGKTINYDTAKTQGDTKTNRAKIDPTRSDKAAGQKVTSRMSQKSKTLALSDAAELAKGTSINKEVLRHIVNKDTWVIGNNAKDLYNVFMNDPMGIADESAAENAAREQINGTIEKKYKNVLTLKQRTQMESNALLVATNMYAYGWINPVTGKTWLPVNGPEQ
jgi:hypothetical protein